MFATNYLPDFPEGFGVVTFYVVFIPLHSAGVNFLVNFGLSFALCYIAMFILRKFLASKCALEDESEARELTVKTRQFEER